MAKGKDSGEGFDGVKPYWCGCFPSITWNGETIECPRGALHIAGIAFPLEHEERPWSNDPNVTHGRAHDGQIYFLDAEKIEEIRKKIRLSFVRRDGARARVVASGAAHFRSRKSDIPVGAFMYMHEMPENDLVYRSRTAAKPMIESNTVAASA